MTTANVHEITCRSCKKNMGSYLEKERKREERVLRNLQRQIRKIAATILELENEKRAVSKKISDMLNKIQ